MPEEILKKLKKGILPQWKVCFISAIVVGFIAHLYKITNWIPNWDSLVFRYDAQNMVSMGRWFLSVASAPSSFYDLPWLTGLMAILFYSLGATLIVKMFSVKKNITAALIGALVVSFPTVTSVMLYNYVADSYALSFLLSCVSALLMTNEKPRYVPAAVLIALSVGIYQAHITVTIMLLLCFLVLKAMKEDVKIKEVLTDSGKFILTGIGGMVLYYLVLMVILKVTGIELLEYQGFDNATSFTGLNIFGSLYTIKEVLLGYFFDFSNGINLFNTLNVLVFVLTAVFCLAEIIRNKLPILKVLIVFVLVALLPFGACVLGFVNSTIDYHNLMKMGFLVFYLFLILQYEKCDFENEKANQIKSWSTLLVSVVLIFNFIIVANVSYHKLNIAYEKSYGTLVRISERISQTDGAENCESILVLGALEDSLNYSSNIPPDITGTTDGFIIRADDEIVGQSVLCSALNDYCGENYKFISGEEKTKLLEKIDSESLGSWPQKNSIQIIDNVIVIKLGD